LASGKSLNVKDFGAAADGVTDDTEAFNRATRATDPWTEDLAVAIKVPAGRYRIAGTVYVRRGQSLFGEGFSTFIDARGATASTFVLGRRQEGERGTADPSGLPISMESLMALGGSPTTGLIYVALEGFQIRNLFLSAVGVGLEIEGADGIVSNITVDQCLNGISLKNSQNVVLDNLTFYLANFGITIDSRCADVVISNSIFSYTRHASVLLADKAHDISAVRLSGCLFTSNEPFSTFLANVYCRASSSDLQIDGCTFRNMAGYAIWQAAGIDLTMDVRGCVIDGRRTNPVYDQSMKSAGIRTGFGSFTINDCHFRNLQAEALSVGVGFAALTVYGGTIARSVDTPILVDPGASGAVRVRDVEGVARIDNMGDERRLLLPSLGSRTHWQVTVATRDPAQMIPIQLLLDTQPSQAARSTGALRDIALEREANGAISVPLSLAEFGHDPTLVEVTGVG
jgi:hypothetical protein